MGDPWTGDPASKVRRVIERVRKHDARLAEHASAILETFLSTAVYLPGPIEPIGDEDLEQSLSRGEELVQAARWELDDSGEVKRWIVNATAWKQMDFTEQAGLILHEVFYVLHAVDVRQNHNKLLRARQVRRFVALISTPWIEQVSDAGFDAVLSELNLFTDD
jgi:hypothetical protein